MSQDRYPISREDAEDDGEVTLSELIALVMDQGEQMNYKWTPVDDDWNEIPYAEWEEVEPPERGQNGVPHNNPKRDPNWDRGWNDAVMQYIPRVEDDSEYSNVEFSWADEESIEGFLDGPYGKLIGGAIFVIILLAVWLAMVVT